MNILRYIEDLFKSVLKNISDFTDLFNWHENLYMTILYLSYVLYFIAFTGVLSLDPSYLTVLETVIKYYISIMLLIRFNPFIERKITKFDKKLVFTSALLLFISTTAYSIAINYFKNLNVNKLLPSI
tara:strand:+ start:319 stop:699 length:381 start_codon:yes stop_codon:yes gene_type:complete